MLKKSGKVGAYLRLCSLLLAFFFGYSMGQENIPAPEPVAIPEVSSPQPALIDPGSLDAIPKGFGAQLQKAQPPPPPPPPTPEPVPVAIVSSSSVVVSSSSSVPAYKFYEDYLDSIVVFAKNILPGKHELETQKALVREKVSAPKGEYEKQADYDARIANFEKDKQKEISVLEKKYEADSKSRMEKLRDAVHYKPDLQPEWGGMLKPDTNVDGYNARIARFNDKISFMGTKIASVVGTLTNLELLNARDMEALDKKNRIYMARLERAIELMQDYILQDNAKVLSTGRKKFDMLFGAYDPEKEHFIVNMSDIHSKTVPFSYVGYIKVSPPVAQEIDRKTDNFLANVDYINFPFLANGEMVFPGTKKADIYYKDKEVFGTGIFQNVPGFEALDGYIEWAVRADSLISGKLVPRKLDSLYAMKKILPKSPLEGTWWSRNKNIVRTIFFVAAAGSAGVAIWQNSEVSSNKDKASDFHREAADANNPADYDRALADYDKAIKDVRSSENMRNGFYIGAGVFGFAGILSLCF